MQFAAGSVVLLAGPQALPFSEFLSTMIMGQVPPVALQIAIARAQNSAVGVEAVNTCKVKQKRQFGSRALDKLIKGRSPAFGAINTRRNREPSCMPSLLSSSSRRRRAVLLGVNRIKRLSLLARNMSLSRACGSAADALHVE